MSFFNPKERTFSVGRGGFGSVLGRAVGQSICESAADDIDKVIDSTIKDLSDEFGVELTTTGYDEKTGQFKIKLGDKDVMSGTVDHRKWDADAKKKLISDIGNKVEAFEEGK